MPSHWGLVQVWKNVAIRRWWYAQTIKKFVDTSIARKRSHISLPFLHSRHPHRTSPPHHPIHLIMTKTAFEDREINLPEIDGIEFVNYYNEEQLDDVMRLVGQDLSEPYSSEL